MKAVGYKEKGSIDREDSLIDIDLPKPSATGHDLLVEIKAISVNPVDYKILRCGRAGRTQCFAFPCNLACETYSECFSGVDASSCQQQIAYNAVADIALQAGNAAESGNQSQSQFGEAKARHLVSDDQIAGQSQFKNRRRSTRHALPRWS